MNIPTIFNYNGANVRTVLINNEPWFVLKDLCEVLEIDHVSTVRKRLSDDVVRNHPIPDALGRMQETAVVNEDGMYDVVLESRKAEAKAFRKWVTSEVLPSIRKNGNYGVAPKIPQTYAEALRLAADLSETNVSLQMKIEADKPLVVFAQSLQVSDTSILIAELAKLLKQNGINIGGTRLFQKLREDGYLMKSGEQYNLPTQRSMDLGLMEIKVGTRMGSNGVSKPTRTPKITVKGQMYFINKYKSLSGTA